VRFGAFKVKVRCIRDFWFVFDTLLVVFMILESVVLNVIFSLQATASGGAEGLADTSSLKLFRLFRLTRMARMVRLLRAMPELMILLKGISVAMRSVLLTLVLLGIIVYLFSIAFRQMTDDTEIGDEHFRTVPQAMLSLLLKGTLPDVADFVMEVSDASPIYGICLLVFILFASLTVMNMLVGVLCEVVSVVSAVEKEQLVVSYVQVQLRSVLEHCIGSPDKPMSKKEFTELLGLPQAARALHEVGVDVLGLMEISDFLFKDGCNLTFPDFMEMVLELRGSNTATVKHIVDLQKFVHLELLRTRDDMEMWFANFVKHPSQQSIDDLTKSLESQTDAKPIVTRADTFLKSSAVSITPTSATSDIFKEGAVRNSHVQQDIKPSHIQNIRASHVQHSRPSPIANKGKNMGVRHR
jgi:hypothetical protein